MAAASACPQSHSVALRPHQSSTACQTQARRPPPLAGASLVTATLAPRAHCRRAAATPGGSPSTRSTATSSRNLALPLPPSPALSFRNIAADWVGARCEQEACGPKGRVGGRGAAAGGGGGRSEVRSAMLPRSRKPCERATRRDERRRARLQASPAREDLATAEGTDRGPLRVPARSGIGGCETRRAGALAPCEPTSRSAATASGASRGSAR